MKNKVLATILMGVLIFSTSVQPIRAEVPEEWRYDEDNWEKYWEELEAEQSKKYQEEISESVRKTLEQDQIKRMEEEAEQAKKQAAYDGAYVDFDDESRYLSALEDEDNEDIFTNENVEVGTKNVVIKPVNKIGSKLKKELKACKRASRVFKYSISNKKNTITMSNTSYKTLLNYILTRFQDECDKVIGMEQDKITKNFEFDTANYTLTVYVTDGVDSEYSYGTRLVQSNIEDVLYYAKLYGLFRGAENPDDLELTILDVYTEELVFTNDPE